MVTRVFTCNDDIFLVICNLFGNSWCTLHGVSLICPQQATFFFVVQQSISLTFLLAKLLGSVSRERALSAEVTFAVKIAITIRPTRIQTMENIRAGRDLGDLSPYLRRKRSLSPKSACTLIMIEHPKLDGWTMLNRPEINIGHQRGRLLWSTVLRSN